MICSLPVVRALIIRKPKNCSCHYLPLFSLSLSFRHCLNHLDSLDLLDTFEAVGYSHCPIQYVEKSRERFLSVFARGHGAVRLLC